MNFVQIKYNNIGNGDGVRTSLFVSGCCHACKGCFNKDSWKKDSGQLYTNETEEAIIRSLQPRFIDGLTLLGGEPLMSYNIPTLIKLCEKVREVYPNKSIWLYSGYTFEEIIKDELKRELLSYCDVLVDGRYFEELYSPKLKFRGSSNQRIIRVKESLEQGDVVLHHKQN